MPPRKSDDPKVAITLRLRRSVMEVWAERARAKGLSSARALMEQKLEEAVEARRPSPPSSRAGEEVTPRFREPRK